VLHRFRYRGVQAHLLCSFDLPYLLPTHNNNAPVKRKLLHSLQQSDLLQRRRRQGAVAKCVEPEKGLRMRLLGGGFIAALYLCVSNGKRLSIGPLLIGGVSGIQVLAY
jgi:hypothetical protein